MNRKKSRAEIPPHVRASLRAEQDAQRAAVQIRKEAERRRVTERGIQIDRAAIAYNALRQNRTKRNSVGIVALKGSSIDYYLQGVEDNANQDNGRIIKFKAETTGRKGVVEIMERMTELQLSDYESELKLVVFEGADYQDSESGASPEVTKIINEMAVPTSTLLKDEYPSLALMVVGTGKLNNLPGSVQYDRAKQPSFAAHLDIMFALDDHNELSCAPETDLPTRITTSKTFVPANSSRSVYPAVPPRYGF